MKLLVVGASGFVGKNVLRLGAKSDWELTATYWKSDAFPSFASRLGFDAVRYDLLGPSRTWDADLCIYLAGNSDHRMSVEYPADDLRLNAEALNRFLAGFSGGLVFMSSGAVYEGHSGLVSPAARTDPRMPYAISKLASEQYLKHYIERDKLAWATILRLFYAYGFYDRATRLIPRLTRAILDRQKTFVITASKGSLLDPLFSEDVARAVLAAANARAMGQTLDLCSGQPRTIPELVREALENMGSSMKTLESPSPNETPIRFYSDPQPTRERLGLGTPVPFAEGLSRYVDRLDANGG